MNLGRMTDPGMTGAAGQVGGGGAPNDLMNKVMEILRKLGLDGPNGDSGALSKDDITKLLKALQQMGPQAIKQVLNQNPGLTQTLAQAI
jgi:hypothetical protein